MKISVIIPLYNKKPYIRNTLDSIIGQTLQNFEVIVVDDGSTDGGDEVVAEYGDQRVRLVRQPNAGPGTARNRGIREASSEYLAFLDADDSWAPQFLEKAVEVLDDSHAAPAAVTCTYIEIPSGRSTEQIWRRRGIVQGLQNVTPQLAPVQLHYMGAYMTSSSTAVRRASVLRWGGFHEHRCRFGEDAMLWLKILLNEPVVFNFLPLAFYNRGASALSSNLNGPRPLEPFIEDPAELIAACPPHLRRLLDRFLGIRAAKTAVMFGYWGKTAEARSVCRRFLSLQDAGTYWYWMAMLAQTRPAGWLTNLFRK